MRWATTSTLPSSRCWEISASATTSRRKPWPWLGRWSPNASASPLTASTPPSTSTMRRPTTTGAMTSAYLTSASTATAARTTGGGLRAWKGPVAPVVRSTTTPAPSTAAAPWSRPTSSPLPSATARRCLPAIPTASASGSSNCGTWSSCSSTKTWRVPAHPCPRPASTLGWGWSGPPRYSRISATFTRPTCSRPSSRASAS